jgi:hypothetical protein
MLNKNMYIEVAGDQEEEEVVEGRGRDKRVKNIKRLGLVGVGGEERERVDAI